jgi:hypothetical protein
VKCSITTRCFMHQCYTFSIHGRKKIPYYEFVGRLPDDVGSGGMKRRRKTEWGKTGQ